MLDKLYNIIGFIPLPPTQLDKWYTIIAFIYPVR